MLILFAFKQNNSEVSAVSVMDRLVRPIAREFEPLTLSLAEWIEVTIFGFENNGGTRVVVLPPSGKLGT